MAFSDKVSLHKNPFGEEEGETPQNKRAQSPINPLFSAPPSPIYPPRHPPISILDRKTYGGKPTDYSRPSSRSSVSTVETDLDVVTDQDEPVALTEVVDALAKGTRSALKTNPLPGDVRKARRRQLKKYTPEKIARAIRRELNIPSDSDSDQENLFADVVVTLDPGLKFNEPVEAAHFDAVKLGLRKELGTPKYSEQTLQDALNETIQQINEHKLSMDQAVKLIASFLDGNLKRLFLARKDKMPLQSLVNLLRKYTGGRETRAAAIEDAASWKIDLSKPYESIIDLETSLLSGYKLDPVEVIPAVVKQSCRNQLTETQRHQLTAIEENYRRQHHKSITYDKWKEALIRILPHKKRIHKVVQQTEQSSEPKPTNLLPQPLQPSQLNAMRQMKESIAEMSRKIDQNTNNLAQQVSEAAESINQINFRQQFNQQRQIQQQARESQPEQQQARPPERHQNGAKSPFNPPSMGQNHRSFNQTRFNPNKSQAHFNPNRSHPQFGLHRNQGQAPRNNAFGNKGNSWTFQPMQQKEKQKFATPSPRERLNQPLEPRTDRFEGQFKFVKPWHEDYNFGMSQIKPYDFSNPRAGEIFPKEHRRLFIWENGHYKPQIPVRPFYHDVLIKSLKTGKYSLTRKAKAHFANVCVLCGLPGHTASNKELCPLYEFSRCSSALCNDCLTAFHCPPCLLHPDSNPKTSRRTSPQ